MSERGLLYFLPGSSSVTRQKVEAVGLGYLLDGLRGPGPSVSTTSRGPDGSSGAVFSVPGRGGRGAVSPTLADAPGMKWRKIPGTPAWLGWLDAARPSPADLERSERVGGHEVELLDGGRWLVPVARLCEARGEGDTRLPRTLDMDENGRWVLGGMTERNRHLFDFGCRFWDELAGTGPEGGDSRLKVSECVEAAVAALALNYRVSGCELAALGAFDDNTVRAVLRALVDWPFVEAFIAGKEGGATLGGSRGAVDSSASNLPSPSSSSPSMTAAR